MKFNVHLTAFKRHGHQIRQVEVPDAECNGDADFVLNRIYWWGQNESQPQNIRSISAGDIIEYKKKLYLILMAGFREVSKIELEEFKKLEHNEKMKYLIRLEKK